MSSAVRGTPTLLGLPYDASSSFLKGTAAAPPLIRQALHSPAGNPWTEMGIDLGQDGALGDVGDVPLGTSPTSPRSKMPCARCSTPAAGPSRSAATIRSPTRSCAQIGRAHV